jgi:hypothetical protein
VLARHLRLLLIVAAPACASSSPAPSKIPAPLSTEPNGPAIENGRPAAATSQGSSDGVTCEEARAQYVEEIGMQAEGPADLTAADYAGVLNQGTYLGPCDVPETSHAQICVAVQNGTAVGVTVSVDPSDASIELCIARQVRVLSFPSHPKMDVARVQF